MIQTLLQTHLWFYSAIFTSTIWVFYKTLMDISIIGEIWKTLRWEQISHPRYNIIMCLLISEIQLQRSMMCLPSKTNNSHHLQNKHTFVPVNFKIPLNSPQITFPVHSPSHNKYSQTHESEVCDCSHVYLSTFSSLQLQQSPNQFKIFSILLNIHFHLMGQLEMCI